MDLSPVADSASRMVNLNGLAFDKENSVRHDQASVVCHTPPYDDYLVGPLARVQFLARGKQKALPVVLLGDLALPGLLPN